MYRIISALLLSTLLVPLVSRADKLEYWGQQRRGANFFNSVPVEENFKAASEVGIEWVRIAFGKWKGSEKDFLAGNLDNYRRLVDADLDKLKQAVRWAEKYDLKVVISPLDLPGGRWAQNNDGQTDERIWQDKKWWKQSASYWRDIAREMKQFDGVVAYNIINEPIPEKSTGLTEHGDINRYHQWYKKYKGSSHDIPAFYNQVIAAIRTEDSDTPIMVDSGWYAQPSAFVYWPKLDDDRVLYAFHMYQPFNYTNRRNSLRENEGKAPYVYPGVIPYSGLPIYWSREQLSAYLQPMLDWAKDEGIPVNRLVASEFGVYRQNPGGAHYLRDLASVLNEKNLHWAFYSFREDEWDGYDYEMGVRNLPWTYWQALEEGKNPSRPYEPGNALWQAITDALQAPGVTGSVEVKVGGK